MGSPRWRWWRARFSSSRPRWWGFHENWLRERVSLAQIAALASEVTPDYDIAETLEYELLTNAGVQRVAMQRDGERVLLLEAPDAAMRHLVIYDYTNATGMQRLRWATETFFAPPGARVARDGAAKFR